MADVAMGFYRAGHRLAQERCFSNVARRVYAEVKIIAAQARLSGIASPY